MYPKFQKYFRQHQPPLLAVWGNGDPFFLPAGAKAFKRDIKDAKVTFFDTGHFALESDCDEIAALRTSKRSSVRGRRVDVGLPPL
jgi:pimeloyl-ACP methyl ester carboxylesterase